VLSKNLELGTAFLLRFWFLAQPTNSSSNTLRRQVALKGVTLHFNPHPSHPDETTYRHSGRTRRACRHPFFPSRSFEQEYKGLRLHHRSRGRLSFHNSILPPGELGERTVSFIRMHGWMCSFGFFYCFLLAFLFLFYSASMQTSCRLQTSGMLNLHAYEHVAKRDKQSRGQV
jgi:hypothetical protein